MTPEPMIIQLDVREDAKTLRTPAPGGGEVVISIDREGVTLQIMGSTGARVLTTFATLEEIVASRPVG